MIVVNFFPVSKITLRNERNEKERQTGLTLVFSRKCNASVKLHAISHGKHELQKWKYSVQLLTKL